MSRAMTYNNPGNVSLPIKGYTGPGTIIGAPGQPGYANFPDLASGFAAFDQRLTNRIGEGYNTIGSLNSIYAQDPNWKNGVSSISGIGVNTPLNTSDPAQMSALQYGIIQHESGNASAFGIDKTSAFGGGGGLPGPVKDMGVGGKASADKNSMDPTPSAQQKDQMKSPASATSQDLFNGAPVYLTDPHGVASEAGQSVQQGAQQAGTDIKGGLTTTATAINDASAQAGGITQYLGNLAYNILPRLGLITMGIILIGGAFIIMGFEQAKKAT